MLSMNRLEFMTPEGFRLDGRKADEPRHMTCKLHVHKTTSGINDNNSADGSAFVQMGNTAVVANVHGPMESETRTFGKCTVVCNYSAAAFAGLGAQLLKDTFSDTILVDLFPRSQIKINVSVLQSDGGERAAAINAITLALIDAGIPMKDLITAAQSAYVDFVPVLDSNRSELQVQPPEMLLAVTISDNNVVMMQHDRRINMTSLRPLSELALKGCQLAAKEVALAAKHYTRAVVLRRGVSFQTQIEQPSLDLE